MKRISNYLRDRLWTILLAVLLTALISEGPIAQLLAVGVATACAFKVLSLVEQPGEEVEQPGEEIEQPGEE
jgi:hypothetical protein